MKYLIRQLKNHYLISAVPNDSLWLIYLQCLISNAWMLNIIILGSITLSQSIYNCMFIRHSIVLHLECLVYIIIPVVYTIWHLWLLIKLEYNTLFKYMWKNVYIIKGNELNIEFFTYKCLLVHFFSVVLTFINIQVENVRK